MAIHSGKGTGSTEGGQKTDIHIGSPHKKDEFPKHLGLKVRRTKFHEFLEPVGLKLGILKFQWVCLWEQGRH